jgi:prepilin-type N-terminal cleavage/methylation domain-containing protein
VTGRSPAPTGSPSGYRGFTLIEVAVAMLIGVGLVVSIGILSQGSTHARATADAQSAAVSLAEQRLEQLRAFAIPGGLVNGPDHGDGSSGNGWIDETGTPSPTGPYRRHWSVDDYPPGASCKRVTITVEHFDNTEVHAELTSYIRIPPS